MNLFIKKVKLRERILKDAGLEYIRFHDLRHTFVPLAPQNGVDVKPVSSMRGHYDAGFTLRSYTHANRQQRNRAAETMGNFMAQVMQGRKSSKKPGRKAELPVWRSLSLFGHFGRMGQSTNL